MTILRIIRAPRLPDPLKALRFPANSAFSANSDPSAVIEFDRPDLDGLPIWGPANAGVTTITQWKPRAQTGYVAWFWWSNADRSFGATNYWGAHPYPQSGSSAGTSHYWEEAMNGDDFIDSAGTNWSSGGSPTAVNVGTTYSQAQVVTRANANSKTFKYYFRLPEVSSADYVLKTITSAGYGEGNPAGLLTIGDSPWHASFQHESASADLFAYKIFAVALSEADILSESADMSQIVTAAGQAAIWWGKKGFTTLDALTCDFGTGRALVRSDASGLLSLV